MDKRNSVTTTHPAVEKATKAFSALRTFESRFEDEAPDAEAQEAQWECHALGLQDQCYGRELSDMEERYEKSRWLRAQFMLRHIDDFRRLTDVVNPYFVALTEAGGQHILAERAGLSPWSRFGRPSPSVQFRTEYPPDSPPLGIAENERLVGGPHVLGARLIWWCAAAKKPSEFGCPIGFFLSILTHPIWATTCGPFGRSTRANQYPVSLMRETAAELVRLVTSELPEQSSAVEDEPAVLEDGPNEEGVFAYQGVPHIFPPTLWALLNYLWRKGARRAYLEDAIEELWGEKTTRKAVDSAVCRINKIFKAKGIPLGVHTRSPHLYLVKQP